MAVDAEKPLCRGRASSPRGTSERWTRREYTSSRPGKLLALETRGHDHGVRVGGPDLRILYVTCGKLLLACEPGFPASRLTGPILIREDFWSAVACYRLGRTHMESTTESLIRLRGGASCFSSTTFQKNHFQNSSGSSGMAGHHVPFSKERVCPWNSRTGYQSRPGDVRGRDFRSAVQVRYNPENFARRTSRHSFQPGWRFPVSRISLWQCTGSSHLSVRSLGRRQQRPIALSSSRGNNSRNEVSRS